MDTRALVEGFMEAFQAGDFDTAASYLSGDFQFSGPVPQPISGPEWMGMSVALKAAFPDINYNFQVVSVEGDVVKTSTQLSGTHTGDLDLSAMGMGVIPATGVSFNNPAEEGEATVRGGKMTSLHINSVPGSGLAGILAQIGVEMPSM
jgi:predicted ester cyclase